MNGTMADAVGQSNRQRMVWLSLLAMPLLFPVALPGMASVVGAFCLLIAFGLFIGQPLPLPGWLAKREMNGRARMLLESMISRVINVIALFGRPRMLLLSDKPVRVVNGLMLAAAGLSMMIPVPIISFDNVLPALAIVLISWGLRLRDGLMLLGGYVVTLAAVASVILLWWGGAAAATELLALMGLTVSP
ncbi:MAG: exopolysaccharide biosynthesis protein [Zoogloeaceae bacterium]|nr:exopolysaccharide biosynthesis protein [Zoogloeaceae bacterium]